MIISSAFCLAFLLFPSVSMCCASSSVMSDSLWPFGLYLTRLLCLWDFPGKYTGVGCHFLLHFLPDPGVEPASPAWKVASLPLRYLGRLNVSFLIFSPFSNTAKIFIIAGKCLLQWTVSFLGPHKPNQESINQSLSLSHTHIHVFLLWNITYV